MPAPEPAPERITRLVLGVAILPLGLVTAFLATGPPLTGLGRLTIASACALAFSAHVVMVGAVVLMVLGAPERIAMVGVAAGALLIGASGVLFANVLVSWVLVG